MLAKTKLDGVTHIIVTATYTDRIVLDTSVNLPGVDLTYVCL